MRRSLIFLWVLAAVAGCRKPVSKDPGAPLSVAPADVPGDEADAPLALTPGQLDRFIAYERELLAAEAALPKQPAGKKDPLAALDRLAREEEALRKKHQLSEREVDGLERMMAQVMDHRLFARSTSLAGLVEQGQKMREKLPAEQRAEFDVELDEMKKEHAAAEQLTDERAQFGDANVTLLLTREADLAPIWSERLARLMGGQGPQIPPAAPAPVVAPQAPAPGAKDGGAVGQYPITGARPT